MGVVMKRAQYFITCNELGSFKSIQDLKPEMVRQLILTGQKPADGIQLPLFQSIETLNPAVR
jgi:predicted DNA-binding helix-hairpin-helix protein